MAKGNHNPPTNGFNKRKNDINRSGCNRLDPIVKQIRELERKELTEQFSEQLRMTKEKLKDVIINPNTPIKELGIAKGILKWLDTGDFSYIQPYIEYIFGKPIQIQRSELTGKDGERLSFDLSVKIKNES